MKGFSKVILALFVALPGYGQGLTITMKETNPAGQTIATIQADRTRAAMDIPSMVSKILYDSSTKTLRVLVPLLKTYREYTPASVQQRLTADTASGRGQASLAPISYRRTGMSKVGSWTCTMYDGFRGAEKVAEVCAAEGSAIGLTAADFALAREAIDMVKAIAPPETIERIPVYGTVQSQGFAGFPVRRVNFRNGQPEGTSELVEFKREGVPSTNFDVPAGYNKAP
jgi:hypothetical protein